MATVHDMFGTRRPLSPDRHELLAASWLKRDLPSRDWMLEDLLCSTSRWLIIGQTGVGKTLVGLDAAFAIAAGANFLTWKGSGAPRRVMYLDGELPAETLKERIQSAVAVYGEADVWLYNRDVLEANDMGPLNTEVGQRWLLREISAVKPEVIVFDNVPALVDGVLDEETWKPVEILIRRLSAGRIAQIWLDQTGHNTTRGYGTKSKEWRMDTVVLLSRPDDGGEDSAIRLEFLKARLRVPATAHHFKPLLISRDTQGWTVKPIVAAPKRKPGEQKRQWFIDAYDFLADGMPTEPGYTKAPVRKVAIEAIRDLMVERSWLSKEDGKIPPSERMAFGRAKDALLGAKIMAAKGDKIWRIATA